MEEMSEDGVQGSHAEFLQMAQKAAEKVVLEAQQCMDEQAAEWVSKGMDQGVHLSSRMYPGVRLPMMRGLMEVSADSSLNLLDLASVMLSHSCRRFFDTQYSHSVLLDDCGDGVGLLCVFLKPTPVSGPTYAIAAYGTRRSRDESGVERLTVAATCVPSDLASTYTDRVKELCNTRDIVRMDFKVWAVDALLRADGTARLGFGLLTDASAIKLPSFLLKQVLYSVPALALSQIYIMAHGGLGPRRVLALTGPDPEETEERLLNGRPLLVSKVIAKVLFDDAD